jgi:putative oxidoreductase
MSWLTWSFLDKVREPALTVLRVGLGAMMVGHGLPKVLNPGKWAGLGGAMRHLGVEVAPELWGALAAFGELFGGALVAVGLLTRPAALVVASILFVAWYSHFREGDSFVGWSHSVETGIGFLVFMFLGGGRFSLDRALLRG